jgi:hypothetical protein
LEIDTLRFLNVDLQVENNSDFIDQSKEESRLVFIAQAEESFQFAKASGGGYFG